MRGLTRNNDGSASLWVVSLAALLVAASAVVIVGAAVVVAHRRAAAAADLSALAAATSSSGGACERAAAIAQANHADLRTCQVALDGSVLVSVAVSVGRLPLPPVKVSARAGQPTLR